MRRATSAASTGMEERSSSARGSRAALRERGEVDEPKSRMTVGAPSINMSRKAAGPLSRIGVLAGVANLGLGFYNICKIRGMRLNIRENREDINSVQRGITENALAYRDLHHDFASVNDDIQSVVNRQAELAASLSDGVVEVCNHMEHLQLEMQEGFENVNTVIHHQSEKENARKLYMKVQMVTESYNNLTDAFAFQGNRYPNFVKRDAEEARRRAEKLYFWAKSFLTEDPNYRVPSLKRPQLDNLQYILGMALAVRTEMDAYILESEMAVCPEDKQTYLNRCRRGVLVFIDIVTRQLVQLVACTSLLDIILDLHAHLAAYATLIQTFRVSLNMVDSPNVKHDDTYTWDDGLSPLRALIYRVSSEEAEDSRAKYDQIELTSLREKLWWPKFTGTNAADMKEANLNSSINVADLCYAFGASESESLYNVRIKTGEKNAMLELQPVAQFRMALWEKVTQVLQDVGLDGQSLTMESFARIRTIPQMDHFRGFIRRGEFTMRGHMGYVRDVAVFAGGCRVVSGGNDKTLRIWNLSTRQEEVTMSGHQGWVLGVAVTHDGERVVSSSEDNLVRVWNASTGQLEMTLQGHTEAVWAVVACPSGQRIISCSEDKTVKVWNITSRREEATLVGHRSGVLCAALAPRGDLLVSGSGDNTIKVWNLIEYKYERTLRGHLDCVRTVLFTPDGQRVVSGSQDKTIRVWNVNTGVEERTITAHTDWVRSLDISPDGKRLVSGSRDKTIKFWDLATGNEDVTLTGHTEGVSAVAFASDGTRLVSSSGDQTLRVWV